MSRGGTYNGAVNFTRSGNAGAWITFRAYQGELPIIQGSGGSGVSSSSAQYVRFVGIAVRNFSSSGFGNGWVDDTGTSNGNLQFINCIADNNGINGSLHNASGRETDKPESTPRPAQLSKGDCRRQCARYVCDLQRECAPLLPFDQARRQTSNGLNEWRDLTSSSRSHVS